jgi:hypothetical protein
MFLEILGTAIIGMVCLVVIGVLVYAIFRKHMEV